MTLIKTPGTVLEDKPETREKGTLSMSVQLLQEDKQNFPLKLAEIRSLKDVVKGAGELAMREIDPNNVESLVCSDPSQWPPIGVTKSDKGYILYDGQHRIQAAKLLKRDTLQATCRTFSDLNDLIEAAFRANLKHGLQASVETKADYCYWLSITYPQLTQQQIAARVGITQSNVSRAIAQRKKQLQEATQEAKPAATEYDDELEVWKEGLVKRTRHMVKSVEKFSKMKGTDGYQELVHDLQLELIREPEDRDVLLFAGQLLVDTAQRKAIRRGKERV